jgi:hypothetical protein
LTVVAVVANVSVVRRLSAVAAALRAREKAARDAFDAQDAIVTKPDVPVGTV